MHTKQQIPATICPSSQIDERGKHPFKILYRGEARDAFLIRFNGVVHGYLNRCVHMPKPLDCEHHNIFDESSRYLQCSMHKICYDPVSGESLSEICAGKKLTALKVREVGGWVYLADKRAVINP